MRQQIFINNINDIDIKFVESMRALYLYSQASTKRTRNFCHTEMCPWGRRWNETPACHPESWEWRLSIWGNRDRVHPSYPGWLRQTLPSLDYYPSLGELSHVFYGQLTCMLLVIEHTRNWTYYKNPLSWSQELHKMACVSSYLKLYCKTGSGMIMEIFVAWRPFSKFQCVEIFL